MKEWVVRTRTDLELSQLATSVGGRLSEIPGKQVTLSMLNNRLRQPPDVETRTKSCLARSKNIPLKKSAIKKEMDEVALLTPKPAA